MIKVNELINFWANVKPESVAFADDSHKITFRELDISTRKIGFLLKEKGIKKGQIVCLILPGYPGWIFSLTLYRLGVTTMMQNNLNSFSSELVPDWVVSLDPHPDIDVNHTIISDKNYMAQVATSSELDNFEGFADDSDIATCYSTSGTNGETKYQAIEAGHMWTEASRVHSSNAFGEDDVFMLLPFGAAWTSLHVSTCLIFGKAYYNCKYTDYRLQRFVGRYPIRTIIGSPIQVAGFLESQKEDQMDLPLLKTVIMGGSPPSEQLVKRIKLQLDCRIFNAYGSTEAGLIAMSSLGNMEPEGAWINPLMDLQIVDDDENILPAMSVGHIRYRRSNMPMSYYKNPIATSQFFREGYFYPGDLGYIDKNGRLLLEGRSTDVINLGGVKINPERIESYALSIPGVFDCAAYSALNGAGVEELCIAIVVDGNFNPSNFEKTMEKRFPNLVRQAKIVNTIPRNETGKIQRNLLAT